MVSKGPRSSETERRARLTLDELFVLGKLAEHRVELLLRRRGLHSGAQRVSRRARAVGGAREEKRRTSASKLSRILSLTLVVALALPVEGAVARVTAPSGVELGGVPSAAPAPTSSGTGRPSWSVTTLVAVVLAAASSSSSSSSSSTSKPTADFCPTERVRARPRIELPPPPPRLPDDVIEPASDALSLMLAAAVEMPCLTFLNHLCLPLPPPAPSAPSCPSSSTSSTSSAAPVAAPGSMLEAASERESVVGPRTVSSVGVAASWAPAAPPAAPAGALVRSLRTLTIHSGCRPKLSPTTPSAPPRTLPGAARCALSSSPGRPRPDVVLAGVGCRAATVSEDESLRTLTGGAGDWVEEREGLDVSGAPRSAVPGFVVVVVVVVVGALVVLSRSSYRDQPGSRQERAAHSLGSGAGRVWGRWARDEHRLARVAGGPAVVHRRGRAGAAGVPATRSAGRLREEGRRGGPSRSRSAPLSRPRHDDRASQSHSLESRCGRPLPAVKCAVWNTQRALLIAIFSPPPRRHTQTRTRPRAVTQLWTPPVRAHHSAAAAAGAARKRTVRSRPATTSSFESLPQRTAVSSAALSSLWARRAHVLLA